MFNNQNTIWESASRPLFVRSIWLERAKSARAPQRHFILDYEAKQKQQEPSNSTHYACNSSTRRRKESFRQTLSYDISEMEQSRTSGSTPDSFKELLTVASSKLQLQPPIPVTQTPKARPKRTGPRRLTKRNLEKLNNNAGHSNRSQQLVSIPFTGLEGPTVSKRLAERVLNWLDLAVKTVGTDYKETDLPIPDNDSPSAQRCSTAKLTEKQCGYQRWKNEEKCRQHAINTNKRAVNAQQIPADSVKCVSIVFEHQQPNSTYNLPAIDVPSRSKRFMNKSADIRRLVRPLQLESVVKSAQEGINCYDNEKRNCLSAKKVCSQQFIQDTRKQLHIFLPNLPDKANSQELSCPSMLIDLASTVDTASTLSISAN